MTREDTHLGRTVDDLTTTDIGGRATIDLISEATHERQGPEPAMQAAEALDDAVDVGDSVLILTGFLIPPTMVQETDGPPGAVSIARAVDAGLDGNPIIACEPRAVDICEATATAGGLSVLDHEASTGSKRSVTVEAFPSDGEDAREYVDSTLPEVDPAAVVAVEKVAPNAEGVYHNMAGYDVSEETSKVGELYDRLDDVLTVSIGDAGNEVGMGLVEDVVRERIDYGAECQCPCGGGIASSIETDLLVPATVSNWGSHAITTCLSEVVGADLLHDPDIERRMLEAAAAAGSIDGIVGGTNAWCDGLPTGAHESVVELLGEALDASVHERGGGELGR
jgi:hypothetical protein